MEDITEDYVSFETAKLLKSKKFHIPTRSHYDSRGGFGFSDICEIDWNNYKCFRERRCYSAPTLQMAMKWLRKAYYLYIGANLIIDFSGRLYWDYNIDTVVNNDKVIYVSDDIFNAYEDAVEAAIRYSLENLI